MVALPALRLQGAWSFDLMMPNESELRKGFNVFFQKLDTSLVQFPVFWERITFLKHLYEDATLQVLLPICLSVPNLNISFCFLHDLTTQFKNSLASSTTQKLSNLEKKYEN